VADEPGRESFIGEPIAPRPGSFDASAMARGGPGLPRAFIWRGVEYEVAAVVATWRSQEPGVGMDKKHLYVRKHWYRVRTTGGETMTVYFDRKPPGRRGGSRQRWYLFSMVGDG
jgi:phosphoribosylglycinamide formyltransferase-1